MATTLQRRDGVLRVRLDRPDRRNALDTGVWRELRDAVRTAGDDADTSVVVLEAAGTVFSSGLDLGEPAPAGDWQERRLWAARWQRLLDDLESLPQVTVAAINGPAIAGGLMLTVACDLRVAADTAFFQVPELAAGMPVTWGCMPRLVRAIGLPRAQDLVLTGRRITAAEAADWGLVQRTVPPDDLTAAVGDLVAGLRNVRAPLLSQARRSLLAAARAEHSWADADILAAALAETNAGRER